MRYVAAVLALFLFAGAAAPAEAGQHGRNHDGRNHGDHSAHSERGHGHGHGGHGGRDRRDHPDFDGPRRHHPDGPHDMRRYGRMKPLGGILHGLRGRHPGRHLDVRAVRGPHGEPYYRVKWLTPDGRVLRLWVDARTGDVVNVHGAPRPGGPGS